MLFSVSLIEWIPSQTFLFGFVEIDFADLIFFVEVGDCFAYLLAAPASRAVRWHGQQKRISVHRAGQLVTV